MTRYLEYKVTYFGEVKTFECRLESLKLNKSGAKELVISYRPERIMHFIGIDFPIGSVSFGYYWENRNYNVYHWKDLNGNTMLFYFNISKETEIGETSVRWKDMLVDIALKSRGDPIVLDENEVPSDMPREDRLVIEETKKIILSALDQITSELEDKTNVILKAPKR
ncbi:MAG TPA: DUF402 domain-containing protein [Nitrososphaerales archaeon]|nr:DUF402 domain-containing protein [Nitrososphaerales archaeon]